MSAVGWGETDTTEQPFSLPFIVGFGTPLIGPQPDGVKCRNGEEVGARAEGGMEGEGDDGEVEGGTVETASG